MTLCESTRDPDNLRLELGWIKEKINEVKIWCDLVKNPVTTR